MDDQFRPGSINGDVKRKHFPFAGMGAPLLALFEKGAFSIVDPLGFCAVGCPIVTSCLSTLEPDLSEVEGHGIPLPYKARAFPR